MVESYDCLPLQIHHFDLYRIEDEHELEYLGFRDYFEENSICCIEWPEKSEQVLAMLDLHIHLRMKGTGRSMLLEAYSEPGNRILSCLKD